MYARAIKDSAGRCSIAEKQQQRWLATADGRRRWCTMNAAGSIAELRHLRLFRQPFDAGCWQVGHGQDQEEIMTIIVAGCGVELGSLQLEPIADPAARLLGLEPPDGD